jgi:hypothetical protein
MENVFQEAMVLCGRQKMIASTLLALWALPGRMTIKFQGQRLPYRLTMEVERLMLKSKGNEFLVSYIESKKETDGYGLLLIDLDENISFFSVDTFAQKGIKSRNE